MAQQQRLGKYLSPEDASRASRLLDQLVRELYDIIRDTLEPIAFRGMDAYLTYDDMVKVVGQSQTIEVILGKLKSDPVAAELAELIYSSGLDKPRINAALASDLGKKFITRYAKLYDRIFYLEDAFAEVLERLSSEGLA